MASKIGDLLVKADLISPEQLETALQEQRQNGGLLGSNLIKLGYIEEKYLTSINMVSRRSTSRNSRSTRTSSRSFRPT